MTNKFNRASSRFGEADPALVILPAWPFDGCAKSNNIIT